MAQADSPASGLSNGGEGLGQQAVERLALANPLFEFPCQSAQGRVVEVCDLGL